VSQIDEGIEVFVGGGMCSSVLGHDTRERVKGLNGKGGMMVMVDWWNDRLVGWSVGSWDGRSVVWLVG
jgi:hypothetical protein